MTWKKAAVTNKEAQQLYSLSVTTETTKKPWCMEIKTAAMNII